MKRKLFKAFLMLVALTIFMLPAYVLAATEDLTTWTEWDPNSRMTVTEDTIYANIRQVDNTGVTYDFGSGYFDEDWQINFTLYLTGGTSSYNYAIVVMLTNTMPNQVSMEANAVLTQTATPDCVFVYTSRSNPYFTINAGEKKAGSADTLATPWDVYDYGSTRYCSFWFDDDEGTYGTIHFDTYVDANRTVLDETQYLALTEENSWRYVQFANACGTSGDYNFTMEISDVEITEGVPPDIEAVSAEYDSYNPYTKQHFYMLTANITEDSGVDHWVTFYYKEDGDPSYDSYMLPSQKEAGDNIQYFIEVEDDTTYWWYCEIYSMEKGTYGFDPEDFIALIPDDDDPEMSTSFFYSFVANGTSSTANLTGTVEYDGGSNTTGLMQYSTNAIDWYDSTDNVTDLQTDDEYTVTLTGLSEDTPYYYRAKGVNDGGGTGYGGVFIFEIVDYYDPVVVGSYSDVTQDSVLITANLTDDGGESEIYVNYQYRVWSWNDANAWITPTTGDYIAENATTNWALEGLLPNTHYEFRVYGFGQCYMQGACSSWYYSPAYSFWTGGYQGTPTIHLDEVGFYDNYTVYTVATVTNDGNLSCTAGIEYSYNELVWYDCDSDQVQSDLETDDEYIAYVRPAKASENVVYRAWVCNYNGCTYSNKIWYRIEAGSNPSDDSDTTPDSNSTDPFDWLARVVLGAIGMNNEGGKLLFVILCMMLLFGIFFKSKFFRIFMPVLCFTAFLVIGWIPVVIMVVVLLGGGLGSWYLFKKAV